MTTSSHFAWQLNLLSTAPAPQRSGIESPFRSEFPGLSRCCSSSAKIHSFRSAFQIQEFLYYHYSQISCHFLNQLESKVTSNSSTLSEYAKYLSPWLKNTVILTTINFQYFWWLWSSPDHLTEGFTVKDGGMLFMILTTIGFAQGNRSYRVPCRTGTVVPPLKNPFAASQSKCIECPPGEFPWRVTESRMCPFSTLSNFYWSFSFFFPFLRKNSYFWFRDR